MKLRNCRKSYKICKIILVCCLSSQSHYATYLPLLMARYGKYMKFPEESHFSSQFKSYRRNR